MIPGPKRRARLALFERHLGWARSIGRNAAKRLPKSFDAADLEQIAAAEHWKQTGLYNPARGVPYQGFALRAIRGACYMSARRDTYRDSTMEDMEEIPPENQPIEKGENPEQAALADEAKSAVLRALSKLPNAYCRVLKLHYFDGLPLAACAVRMRRRPHDIYELKEKAMGALRAALAPEVKGRGEPGPIPAWGHRLPDADEQAGDWSR